jgi:hypothetical protein
VWGWGRCWKGGQERSFCHQGCPKHKLHTSWCRRTSCAPPDARPATHAHTIDPYKTECEGWMLWDGCAGLWWPPDHGYLVCCKDPQWWCLAAAQHKMQCPAARPSRLLQPAAMRSLHSFLSVVQRWANLQHGLGCREGLVLARLHLCWLLAWEGAHTSDWAPFTGT